MAFLRMEPTVSGSPYGRKAFASGPGGRSVDSVNPYAKHIPRAALGKDVARIRRIGLELAPQPHDLRVDRTVVDVIAVVLRVASVTRTRRIETIWTPGRAILASHGRTADGYEDAFHGIRQFPKRPAVRRAAAAR